ncbi:hypothetical protein CSUI_010218 [Cystoisospora suis]|uniref:Transmembrane protein n=1 Tax=Cystoisospora suis TaxID=483139 RepID=A0A2C6KH37_9APIC|nr:hypothetical protein CSUI_010218 [Cystoisospora suis]
MSCLAQFHFFTSSCSFSAALFILYFTFYSLFSFFLYLKRSSESSPSLNKVTETFLVTQPEMR